MDISGKIWGATSKIFCKNNIEVYRISGKRNGRSSNHKHNSKWSMFFVESGSIKIVTEKNDYSLTDETILSKGQTTIIRPGEFHYFEVLQDKTICFEFYWTEIDPNDIIRKDCGQIKSSRKRT